MRIMSVIKKRLLTYFTKSVPFAGLVISVLAYIYFVLINHQTSPGALFYVSIPFDVGVLIALPFWGWLFWVWIHKNKTDANQKVKKSQ